MTHLVNVQKLPGPILIVSPHPDDDILSSGGLIQRALQFKKTVYVLFVTTGDANGQSVTDYLHKPLCNSSYRQLGYVRHAEAIRAEKFLGVPERHLFFLGYPDGVMYDIATDCRLTRIHRSSYTGFSRAVYPFAYRCNAPYTHAMAVALMASVLRKTQPGTVVVNLGIDLHPDHVATRILMLQALRPLHMYPVLLSYLIHYPDWPNPHGLLRAPKGVDIRGLTYFLQTTREEKRTFEAYQMHRSQAVLSTNNDNLIRRNELFWVQKIKR